VEGDVIPKQKMSIFELEDKTRIAVRGNFNDWGIYGRGWYTAHPGAWYAAGWAAGSAWNWATWPVLGAWFGYADTVQPVSYDYGTNITYENNNVYYGDQSVGTAADLIDAGNKSSAGLARLALECGSAPRARTASCDCTRHR
jgi:hypothetical protein